MSRETNAVKTMSAIAIILIVNCLVPSLEAKDIIRDKSPDGKFALRITKEDVGWGAAIINLKSKTTSWDWRFTRTSPRKRIWYGQKIHKESLISSRIVAVAVPRFTFEKAQCSKKFRCRTVTFPHARKSQ